MTDAIRKKHEAFKRRLIAGENIRAAHLSISEVDALFAALDEAKDGLTAAHMHGFEEGRDQYMDKVRKLQDALDAERGRIYPCADCGKMRTKEEGGTTFTVCDECWDKRFDKKGNK